MLNCQTFSPLGGTAANRTNKVPTTVLSTRRLPQKERNFIVTAASQLIAKASTINSHQHKQHLYKARGGVKLKLGGQETKVQE